MRTRGTAITPKFAKKVCELYPNINRNWLLSGEGEMLKAPTANVRGNNSQITNTTDAAGFLSALEKSQSHIDRLLAIIERMQGVAVVLLALIGFVPSMAQDTIRFKDGTVAIMGEGVNRDYTIINENDTAVFVRHVAGGVAPISKTRIASVGYGPKLQPPALAPILKPDPTASLLDVVELQTRGLILTNVWGPSFTVAGVLGLCGSLYGWRPGSRMDPWRAGAVVTSLVFLGGGVACFTIGHNMRVDARGITITF